MNGTRRSMRARQFASDFLVGLAISLLVLGLSCFGAVEARSAPVVATQSGAIIVEGHPIGMRGPLAQNGFDRVLSLHAVGLGKAYARPGNGENEAAAEIEVAIMAHPVNANDRRSAPVYMTRHEQHVQAWTLAAMIIAFGLMTALTLGLWRNLSGAVAPHRRWKS